MQQIDELHKVQLGIAKYFKMICEENKLKYYIIGGSLLGAVRHKGFIPWDDDMDFALLRKDYQKFKNIMKFKNEKYKLENSNTNKFFPCPFCKLVDANTTLVEKDCFNNKYISGCFIDIFPLDFVGNTKRNVKALKKVTFYKRLIAIHETKFKTKNIFKKFVGFTIRLINNNFYIKMLEKQLSKCGDETDDCIANLVGAYGDKEIMKKEWFGRGINYVFENIQFVGPQNCDLYLKHLYGDYMKLPPIEKQINSHAKFIDLSTPYEKYKNDNFIIRK